MGLGSACIDNPLNPSYDLNIQDTKQWGMLFHLYAYLTSFINLMDALEGLGLFIGDQ